MTTTTKGPLKSATIDDFKGILHLEIHPDGRGVVFRGPNGSGKTSAIDALAWGLGLNLDEEVIRNGAEKASVRLVYEGYQIERSKKRGGKPTLKVKDDKGRPYNSPTELVRAFAGAIDHKTFSRMSEKEQADVLRRIAPGLDCADLDERRASIYADRTDCGRRGKELAGQLAGIVVPPPPAGEVGEEKSLAEVLRRQREVQEQVRKHDQEQAQLVGLAGDVKACEDMIGKFERKLAEERQRLQFLQSKHAELAAAIGSKTLPDLAALEQEAATLEEHNAQVRARKRALEEVGRQEQARKAKQAEVDKARAEWERMTGEIEKIDAEKAKRLASVKLPVQGLALTAGVATFDDGQHGPVAIAGLNSATRIRLDVAVGQALGHKLVSAPEASLLDSKSMAELDAFAREHGMQLLAERVIDGAPGAGLVAVIEEGEATVPSLTPQPEPELPPNATGAKPADEDLDDFGL